MSDSRMPAPAARAAALAVAASALTCQVEVPTANRDELVKSGVAVEIVLPFDEFVASTAVYGGFGRASALGGGFVAHEFGAEQSHKYVNGVLERVARRLRPD